jgi:integrase/recombinase XerC
VANSSLSEIIKRWCSHLHNSRSLSICTINSYVSDIKQLVKFLERYKEEDVDLKTITTLCIQDIRAWFLHRCQSGDSAKTIARGLSATKNLLKYLIEIGAISNNDVVNMKPPKIKKTLPRPLSIDQINDILDAVSTLKTTKWIVIRDKALLSLIYSVGLRISEALNLNESDIVNSSGFINISGKGGKNRSVPLADSIKSAILEYIEAKPNHDSPALFINKDNRRLSPSAIQKLIRRVRSLLGLSDRTTPHALRHSCATHLMESSGELRSIQELLGHSSISSTQIYADVAQKYVSDVYDKCHPLARKKP